MTCGYSDSDCPAYVCPYQKAMTPGEKKRTDEKAMAAEKELWTFFPSGWDFDRGPGRLFYFKDYGVPQDVEPVPRRPNHVGSSVDRRQMMETCGNLRVDPAIQEVFDDLLPRCDALAREVGGMLVVQESMISFLVNIEFYGPYLFLDNDLDKNFLRDLTRHADVFAVHGHPRGVKVEIGLHYYRDPLRDLFDEA